MQAALAITVFVSCSRLHLEALVHCSLQEGLFLHTHLRSQCPYWHMLQVSRSVQTDWSPYLQPGRCNHQAGGVEGIPLHTWKQDIFRGYETEHTILLFIISGMTIEHTWHRFERHRSCDRWKEWVRTYIGQVGRTQAGFVFCLPRSIPHVASWKRHGCDLIWSCFNRGGAGDAGPVSRGAYPSAKCWTCKHDRLNKETVILLICLSC